MKFTFQRSSPFVKVLLAVYIAAGLVFQFAPESWFPSTYPLSLMSKLSFVSALLILLPALILKPENKTEEAALRRFQDIVAFGLVINGLGGLGLYKLYRYGFQYDKLTHFITPLVLTIGFVELMQAWKGWSKKTAFIFSAIMVFAGGIIWEILEFYSDRLLGTTLIGLGGEHQRLDTIWDVVFNTLGILSAAAYFYFKQKKSVISATSKQKESARTK